VENTRIPAILTILTILTGYCYIIAMTKKPRITYMNFSYLFWILLFVTYFWYDSWQCRVSLFQVILVPHSHTDPGWLKTFEQYFHSSTRNILNNMVSKLQQWPNMTFIWSEVSFLSLWWDRWLMDDHYNFALDFSRRKIKLICMQCWYWYIRPVLRY